MNKKILFAAILGVAIVGLGLVFWKTPIKPAEDDNKTKSASSTVTTEQKAQTLDSFAQCLAEKKVTMYGAAWCPHCQNQKKLFGDSFKYVPYVECPDHPDACLQKGVEGYPTWILGDGTKLEAGEKSLNELSSKSGCQFP